MDPKTGEIKKFSDAKEIPRGWLPIPSVGTQVEITWVRKLPGSARRTERSSWIVAHVENEKPGRIILQPVIGQ